MRQGDTFVSLHPVNAVDVNLTTAIQGHAVVTPDELHLYFGSTREGGEGGVDIYVASRMNTADMFGEATRIPSVGSERSEFPNWLCADQCTMYLQRKGIENSWDLYVAQRTP